MPIIGIIASLPTVGHDPGHCDDFLGLKLEADDEAVDEVLTAYPGLPRLTGHYGVVISKAIRALDQQGKEQDVIYWNATGEPILWIPHHCAEILQRT